MPGLNENLIIFPLCGGRDPGSVVLDVAGCRYLPQDKKNQVEKMAKSCKRLLARDVSDCQSSEIILRQS